jgi:starvation-inducible outer membrane lipoprotein
MKIKATTLGLALLTVLLLQGCIAFPPLVQVEHKDNTNNQEILRRLDAIDHRLGKLEQKAEKNP